MGAGNNLVYKAVGQIYVYNYSLLVIICGNNPGKTFLTFDVKHGNMNLIVKLN